MLYRQGFTLIEMLVTMIIIAVVLALTFPNFAGPTEQAKASNAQNNLLAIYTAERNYYNNKSIYCLSVPNSAQAACTQDTTCGDSLAQLNCNLSLNIQDDGSYTYSCSGSTCIASRTGATPSPLVITATLTQPILLSGEKNPTCIPAASSNSSWCP